VSVALSDVLTKDQDLLALHAHELALVHRFGLYLEGHLRPVLRKNRLTVDLDYDRHGDLPSCCHRDRIGMGTGGSGLT
jgi:hypothetical protein